MTNRKNYSLKVNVEDTNGVTDEATWDVFRLTDDEFFTLELTGFNGGLEGNGANTFENDHSGMKFSTWDNDNDMNEFGNCAQELSGSWWFNNCGGTNFNGQNFNSASAPSFQGIIDFSWRGFQHSLRSVRMSIKAL